MSTHMVHCGEHQDLAPQETAVGFLCADIQGETSKTDEECSRHRNDVCKGSGAGQAFSHHKDRKRGLGRGRERGWSLAG